MAGMFGNMTPVQAQLMGSLTNSFLPDMDVNDPASIREMANAHARMGKTSEAAE